MMRWRLLLEEYHPKVVHTKGVDNNAADAISRLDLTDKADDLMVWGVKSKRSEYINVKMMNICMFLSECEFKEDGFDSNYSTEMTMSDAEKLSAYALDLMSMCQTQLTDEVLMKVIKQHITSKGHNDTIYAHKSVEDVELIHKNNRILVPQSKQQSVLDWYHSILIHPGKKQMIETIKLVFTWSGLNKQVKELVKTCHQCQMCKRAGKKKYGLLPSKTAESTRWNRINVNLWGPKSVVNVNGYTYELHVMTMVDPVTRWFEQQQIWSTQCLCMPTDPRQCVAFSLSACKEIGYDNGSEFKMEFQDLYANMGLKPCPSNAWNPQSNTIRTNTPGSSRRPSHV